MGDDGSPRGAADSEIASRSPEMTQRPGGARSGVARAQHLQGLVKARAVATEEWLEERRHDDRKVDYALSAFERDRSTGGIVLSGAVAFRLFLFYVPFVVLIILVLGIGTSPTDSTEDLARKIGIGGLIAKAAGGTNNLSGWERFTSVVVVTVGVIYGARAFYRVLHIVYSLEWSIPVTRVRATKPAFIMIVFVTVGLGSEFGLSRLRSESAVGGAAGTIFLFFLLPAGFWLAGLQYLPHDRNCPWWAQIPGAVVIAIGIEGVHLFTIYWLARQLDRKSELYGAIGGSLDILLWAYVIGRLIVLGVVINSLMWERHEFLTRSTAAQSGATEQVPPQSSPDPVVSAADQGGSTTQKG